MKNLTSLFLSTLLVSCVMDSPKVEMGGFNRYAPMVWVGQFPKTIQISKDFNSQQKNVISNMALSWNEAVGNEVEFFKIGEDTEKIEDIKNLFALDTDGLSGVYLVPPEKMPNADSPTAGLTIAVTVLKLKTQNYGKPNEFNQIFYADIYVKNDPAIPYRNDTPSQPQNSYDLNTVMVHEFGHFLGLDHSPSSKKDTSIMIPSILPEDGMKAPRSYDISNIKLKYGISGPITPGAAGIAIERPKYVPDNKGDTPFVKYIIELKSNGDCIHSTDGKIIRKHKRF